MAAFGVGCTPLRITITLAPGTYTQAELMARVIEMLPADSQLRFHARTYAEVDGSLYTCLPKPAYDAMMALPKNVSRPWVKSRSEQWKANKRRAR